MYALVNSMMEFLKTFRITDKDQKVLENLASAQLQLEAQKELTPEEQLAVKILMKRNEQVLLEYLNKMVEENADKS